ncbi:caspase, EACC1-associated type [Kibdelosporangium aridum]|uniref:Caspase domain-containing protein n=1 Tax=Kibdelosporangium aridum TaxID=2030 RepID=A0A1Y5Y593_KIBAR|nr:caspase family protein [Kibdelosporangium aridum]SMD25917.1 Caspase domain-containing protein [Kibdelosporangium aridum]
MTTMDGARSALIIATDQYTDPGLRQLRAPASDARALAAVLRDPAIGGFDVHTLLNEPAHEVNLAVEEFFADRRPDDLLLAYFSCHGIKDEDGELYFAAENTRLLRLGATAVAADFVNRRMGRSRSRRIVLLLDCCYAGAFERGMTARAGAGVGIETQLGGRGRAVITASSAMEYAFEGDELADTQDLQPSVFTSALVTGLQTGDADRDQDGMVALDELYDYVYEKVRAATPNQTPGKWTFGVQGDLYVARRARPVTVPAALPHQLQDAIDSPFAGVRAAVVQELVRLLQGRHAGLALAARQALERFTSDDSRTVANAAAEALGSATAPVSAEPPPTPAEKPVAAPAPSPAQKLPEIPAAPESFTEATTAPPVRDDYPLIAAGALAILAAVLEFLALFPEFVSGFRLTDVPSNTLSVVIATALGIGVGVCLLMPRTRSVGAGLLLGAVATAPAGPMYDINFLITGNYGEAGAGLWLDLIANVALIVAATVVVITLVRKGSVHITLRRTGLVSWFIVLLGVAGAAALFFESQDAFVAARNQDFVPEEDMLPLIWASTMALVLPAIAATARPRSFGVALLAGWIGCGVNVVAFNTGFETGSVFGYTLLALLVVIIPFARAAQPLTRDAKR